MVGFDGMRAVVAPGRGIVLRFPGLVCLIPDADSTGLDELVSICVSVAAEAPDAPARPLARKLAAWLASADDAPEFGTLAAAGSRVGVFLHGGACAVLGDERISGADSAAWTDRLITAPDVPLALRRADEESAKDEDGVLDLQLGVVPGGGVILVPTDHALRARPPISAAPARKRVSAEVPGDGEPIRPRSAVEKGLAGVPDEQPTPHELPVPDEVPGVDIPGAGEPPSLRPPKRAAAIFGIAPKERARPPLDAGAVESGTQLIRGRASPAPQKAPVKSDDRAQARGFLCSRNHLNDPRNQFCIICGIRMDERTGVAVLGTRPPLGLLVFDDGATFTVDADYLLGRTPEADPRVRSGALRPLTVQDPDSQVSRGHLVIKLDGWDVTAIDESRNGTLVARPTEQSWSRLPSRQPLRLVPGTRIRVGGRSFIFESPSGVR